MELISPRLMSIMAVIAIITGLALTAWWIIATYWIHGREEEARLRLVKLPADLREVISGVPAALVVFYVFTAVTLVAYVIYVWLSGVTY